MKTQAEQHLSLLQEQVEKFKEMGGSPAKKLTQILAAVTLTIQGMKDDLEKHPFADAAEEIDFFKYSKPQVIAEQIFALEIFTIESSSPAGDELVLRSYYEQELKIIRRFFEKHRFLYQYYLIGGHELDSSYFMRGSTVSGGLLPVNPDRDPAFSAPADYLFAKFIACERLQEYLINCLYRRKEENAVPGRTKRKPFSWTGDKSNLIEIAYGLYGTQQINDGKATISEIIEWLEESLNINLSRYYRRFSEIKMRKSISHSKYLDEMRAALLRYIAEGDAWKPGVRK